MRYTITIPENLNDGTPVPVFLRANYEDRILDIFGGFTLHSATGVWRGEVTYVEAVNVYECYKADQFGTEHKLVGLAKLVCRTLDQEAVFVTIGHRHELVTLDTPDPSID